MARSALVFVLSALFLGACHVSRNAGDSEDNVSVKASENGRMSFKLPFAKGEIQIPHAVFENGQFDIDGVKMVPAGRVHGFNMDAGEGGATVHLDFSAPKSPQEVRSYFFEQFRQKGDPVSQSANGLSGKSRDGDTFSISVGPAAEGSAGTIVIQSKA